MANGSDKLEVDLRSLSEENTLIDKHQYSVLAVADMYHNEGNEELEFNIKTDEDDLGDPADPDIDLREYQKELAKEGCEGENVIVIAPTNSGKTRVAFKIMQVT